MKKQTKILCLITAAMILSAIWAVHSNTNLEVTEYTVASCALPKNFDGFRIVQVSDLHNASFGEENRDLIRLLEQTEPDIIVLTGDLIDSRRTDIQAALAFAKAAADIAPVYYVTGNHEARVARYHVLRDGLVQAGVTVLDNKKLRLYMGGESITLIGVSDPSFSVDYLLGDSRSEVSMVLTELTSQDDGFTVLLSHRPELFDLYAAYGADLVFSGHAHGGQIRIPVAGGLFAPNQGFFPEYDSGLFQKENTHMIVSRGVGNSVFPIRINNPPEIVVCQLKIA